MGQTANYCFDGSGVGVPLGADRRTVQARYTFAAFGGGTGSYNIGKLNNGVRILGGHVEVAGTPTAVSGTPTIAIQVEGANDIISAASVLGAPWSTTGKKAITPKVNTPESTSITLTADRNIVVAIAAAAINTGDFTVFLDVLG